MIFMKIVNKEEFDAMVNQGSLIVDFYANWCGPCRMLAPVLEEVSEEHPNVQFIKVNVDDEPELAQRYGVMSIPALFAIKDGEVKKSVVGFQPKAMVENLIKTIE